MASIWDGVKQQDGYLVFPYKVKEQLQYALEWIESQKDEFNDDSFNEMVSYIQAKIIWKVLNDKRSNSSAPFSRRQ